MSKTRGVAGILPVLLLCLAPPLARASDADRPTSFVQKQADGPWELYSQPGDGRQAGNPGRVCAYGIVRSACDSDIGKQACEPYAMKFVGRSGGTETVQCVGSGASREEIAEGLRRAESLK